MAESSSITAPVVSSRNSMAQLNNNEQIIVTDAEPYLLPEETVPMEERKRNPISREASKNSQRRRSPEDFDSLSLYEPGMNTSPWQEKMGPIISRNGEEELCNMPSVQIKGNETQQTFPKTAALTSTQQDTSHGEAVNNYSSHQHTKCDHLDILILHAEDDHEAAKTFKKQIKNFKISIGTKTHPEVQLLDDVKIPGHDKDAVFDYVVSMAVYVFLYVTESFCRDVLNIIQSHSCLRKTLKNIDKRWTVIPVHTVPKPRRNYELPGLLDNLQPLNSFAKSFEKDVKKLLERKEDFILERMASCKGKNVQKCIEEHLQPSRTSPETVRKSYINASDNTPLDGTHTGHSDQDISDSGFLSYTSGPEPRSFNGDDNNSLVTTDDASDYGDSQDATENVGEFAQAPHHPPRRPPRRPRRHPPPPYTEQQSPPTSYSRDALQQGDYSATVAAPPLNFTSLPEAEDNKAIPASNFSTFFQESVTGCNFMLNSHLCSSHTGTQTQQMGRYITKETSESPAFYDGSQGIDSGMHFNQPLQSTSNMPEHTDFSHSQQQKVKCKPGRPIRNSITQTEDTCSSHKTRFVIVKPRMVAFNSKVILQGTKGKDSGIYEDSDSESDEYEDIT